MGERKVLNKYYPRDFDPAVIPRGKGPKNRQFKIRMELPMNVRCDTCGEFMYKGKRFNARKEDVVGEDYLGLRLFRFYLKCVCCSSEFTIKTDLENMDYVCEHGVSRNFEPWREQEQMREEEKKRRAEVEEGDTMAQLEHRTLDSKKEMEDLDILEEIKTLNARNAAVDASKMLEMVDRKRKLEQGEILNEADEETLQAFKTQLEGGPKIRRLDDTDDQKPKTSFFSGLKRGRAGVRGRGRRGRAAKRKRLNNADEPSSGAQASSAPQPSSSSSSHPPPPQASSAEKSNT